MKEGCQAPKILQAGSRRMKLPSFKQATLHDKGRMTEDGASSPEVGATRPKGRAESYRKLLVDLEI